jgi:DNA (cytosine-5)-methyltransferase 1
MTLTVTDLFCGAGGSSQGAEEAGGRLTLGLNHWRRAIDTHATNFPNADHDCADVSVCDPRYYPTSDLLIASPECSRPGRWS